jgi:protocatechuate 4,5-dioxygenase beta chain
MSQGLESEPYWKRFFEGYEPVKEWLTEVDPDIAIVVYNDHGLNFFLDKLPTVALGCADIYHNADDGWGCHPRSLSPAMPHSPGILQNH